MLGALGGLGLLAACSRTTDPTRAADPAASSASRKATGSGPVTVRSWAANRGTPFYIAHRGAGDVYPEHSMPSYRAAVEMGAQCLEVSVNMTSDGVLICLHDLSYDRTTTGKGLVADAAVLGAVHASGSGNPSSDRPGCSRRCRRFPGSRRC